MDLCKSLYPLLLCLDPRNKMRMERLMERRRKLVFQVRDIVDAFGEEIFPDCEDVRTWKGRGPRGLYASVSPELERGELGCLDGFV